MVGFERAAVSARGYRCDFENSNDPLFYDSPHLGQLVAGVMRSSLIYKHIYQRCEGSRSGTAIFSFDSMGREASSNSIRRAS